MICYYSNDNINIQPCVLALGNFDGVHKGHAFLLRKTYEYAKSINSKLGVYTFEANPKLSCGEKTTRLISTNQEKISAFEKLGVDFVYFEDFSKVKNLKKQAFAAYISEKFNVQSVFCGENFKYAKGADGDCDSLKKDLEKLSISLNVISLLSHYGESISSTRIRNLIENGDIKTANELLGYNFSICDKVVHGNFLGHKIGFPTVNLKLRDNIVHPMYAVYASEIIIDGQKYYGVTNIGTKPTVSDDLNNAYAETHIFDFDDSIYDKTICVRLCTLIRKEKKFSNLEELMLAIKKDVCFAKKFFGV